MDACILRGIFNWDGGERRSLRYGGFRPGTSTYDERTHVKLVFDLAAVSQLALKRVRVTCAVRTARESGHIGDKFLKIFPTKPRVGEVVDLGVGILMIDELWDDGLPQLLLCPADGRQKLWIDPRKLYRLHDQTVDILIEPTTDPFSAAPDIALPDPSAPNVIHNADGSMQMVNIDRDADTVRITPDVKSLGDGTFVVTRPGSRATVVARRKPGVSH